MVLIIIAFWLAAAALSAGLLHHARPRPLILLATLGPLCLLYLLGLYLSPIDPTPKEVTSE
jgi:hypothetical protein